MDYCSDLIDQVVFVSGLCGAGLTWTTVVI